MAVALSVLCRMHTSCKPHLAGLGCPTHIHRSSCCCRNSPWLALLQSPPALAQPLGLQRGQARRAQATPAGLPCFSARPRLARLVPATRLAPAETGRALPTRVPREDQLPASCCSRSTGPAICTERMFILSVCGSPLRHYILTRKQLKNKKPFHNCDALHQPPSLLFWTCRSRSRCHF